MLLLDGSNVLLLLLLLSIPPGLECLTLNGVTLKIAVDAQGGVADQAAAVSDRFTCSESLDAVHRLRSDSDAILIGRQTVVADNPSLLVRRGIHVERQPLRVILDSNLSLLSGDDSSYQIFTDGHPTLVYHGPYVELDKTAKSQDGATNTMAVPSATDEHGKMSIPDICRDLRETHNIQHLMVEGGPTVATSFLKHKLVDRCVLFRATTVCFREPIPSGIDETILKDAGLKLLGIYSCGVDEVECWSKEGWPTEELSDWP